MNKNNNFQSQSKSQNQLKYKNNKQQQNNKQQRSKNNSTSKTKKIKINNQSQQYQPKLRAFKHKFLRTDQDQRKIKQRIQLQEQEQNVINKALECFKKGQIINIDWKTRTNFRKSSPDVKFPRIQTQPIEVITPLTNSNKNISKSIFNSIYESKSSKAKKLKSIQQKCQKLTDLINHRNATPKYFKAKFFSQQKGTKTPNQSNKKSVKQNSRIQDKVSTFKNDQLQKQKQKGNFMNNSNDQDGKFNFQNHRSLTGQLKISIVSNTAQSQKDRKSKSRLSANKNASNSRLSNSQKDKQSRYKSIGSNKQYSNKNLQTIKTKQQQSQRKISGRDPEKYDLLEDPAMYLLISKSRQKLIDFKQRVGMENMTTIQKFKFMENKQKQLQNHNEKQVSKFLQKNISASDFKQSQRQSILNKLKQKKRLSQIINTQKMSKIFKQSEKYLKKFSKQKQPRQSENSQYNYGIKSLTTSFKNIDQQNISGMTFDIKQNKIRARKQQSIISVQQRLLKKAKLTYLKEDLILKFEQIRNYQQSPKSVK